VLRTSRARRPSPPPRRPSPAHVAWSSAQLASSSAELGWSPAAFPSGAPTEPPVGTRSVAHSGSLSTVSVRSPDPEPPNDPAVEAAFQAVPDTMVAEILDGELHTMSRPARPHTRAASRLGIEIGGPFDAGRGGPGGWVILDEPELHLGKRPDK